VVWPQSGAHLPCRTDSRQSPHVDQPWRHAAGHSGTSQRADSTPLQCDNCAPGAAGCCGVASLPSSFVDARHRLDSSCRLHCCLTGNVRHGSWLEAHARLAVRDVTPRLTGACMVKCCSAWRCTVCTPLRMLHFLCKLTVAGGSEHVDRAFDSCGSNVTLTNRIQVTSPATCRPRSDYGLRGRQEHGQGKTCSRLARLSLLHRGPALRRNVAEALLG
jgi:hypothetical protein